MKKILGLMIVLLGLNLACKQEKEIENAVNQKVTIEDETMLLGVVTKDVFQEPDYKSWYDYHYEEYTPNDSILNLFGDKLRNIDITVVMGTWCSDSEREIPAFYKFLENSEVQPKSYSIIATDRTKKQPEDLLMGFDIVYIPTIIVKRNGEELGRIIESPTLSLEEDLLNFLSEEK